MQEVSEIDANMRKLRINELISYTEESCFTRVPEKSAVEWCEENLELSTMASNTAGKYSTSLTPYVREIINSIKSLEVERVVVCFGAQTGKTQSFMAALAYFIANAQSPAMWVMPTIELAKSFSKSRLQPFLFSSKRIESLKEEGRYSTKLIEMTFRDSVLTLSGSNSPSSLSSRPVKMLVLDEVDKFPTDNASEADAVSLAIERTKTFADRKIYESSTPTIITGTIWQDFLKGDQRRYFVPCPHCGKEIILVFNSDKSVFKRNGYEAELKWDSGAKGLDGEWDISKVESSAYFECPHCKGKIEEKHKLSMVMRGKWKATASGNPRIHSYHLPSFYAPWRNTAWGILAGQFLEEKRSLLGLRNFINSTCAEPDMGQYEGRSGGRKELIVGEGGLENGIRIMTVDVQKDHFWYVIREWEKGGNSILIEWGKLETFEDIYTKQAEIGAKYVGIDSGFSATEVYEECARHKGWFACRGDERPSWPNRARVEVPYYLRQFDPLIGKKNQGRKKIAELRWSNPTIKDILHRLRNSETSPIRWAIPEKWATEEYFRQMDSEVKRNTFNPKTGRITAQWVLRSSHWDNHIFDCECEQIAVAICISILDDGKKRKERQG